MLAGCPPCPTASAPQMWTIPAATSKWRPSKKLKEDSSWIRDAKGKVLKAISMLLFDLPKDQSYRVVFHAAAHG